MTSDNPFQLLWTGLGLGLVWLLMVSSPGHSAARRYGPTMPGGYYVRVTPAAITTAHSQRPRLTVRIEDAAGAPIDHVLVSFLPSEGSVTTASSRSRGGRVIGTFLPATGSDNPRRAFIVVTVEDVEVTVFVDIVPAVFGR